MYIMKELLDEFICSVTEENGIITLTYCHLDFSGTCVYKEHNTVGINKPIRQRFYTLTSSDMGDVIEYIYQKGHIKDGDFNKIGSELQDYSLSLIHDHQSHQRRDDE